MTLAATVPELAQSVAPRNEELMSNCSECTAEAEKVGAATDWWCWMFVCAASGVDCDCYGRGSAVVPAPEMGN